jgi:hypothetical protein
MRFVWQLHFDHLESGATGWIVAPALNFTLAEKVTPTSGFSVLFGTDAILFKESIRPRGLLYESYGKRPVNVYWRVHQQVSEAPPLHLNISKLYRVHFFNSLHTRCKTGAVQ